MIVSNLFFVDNFNSVAVITADVLDKLNYIYLIKSVTNLDSYLHRHRDTNKSGTDFT